MTTGYLRRIAIQTYCGALLAASLGAGAPARAAEPEGAAEGVVEAVLEVTSRAAAAGESLVVLRGPGGALYLEEGDFAKLRLPLPKAAPYEYHGHRYFQPTALAGCTVTVDEAHQRVLIKVPPAELAPTRVSAAARPYPSVTAASPGGFLNYQMSAQQIQGQGIGGVLGELGMFASPGVLTNSMVGRYELGTEQAVRLDTTFTRDFVDSLDTLNLGDSISDPGTWGNAVRFAGVRWSRNFALRPDLLTTPLLSAGGLATVPSTVDVFVNNQLVNSSQLPAGPFIVDRLPTVTGTGDVSVVVRDALGREQVMTQSFYSSASLLARGLTQYSVDLGNVRNNYALASDDYGAMLAEGSYRRGITDAFTLEGHAEYLKNAAHAAGLNAAFGLGHFAVLNVTAANGGDAGGTGWLNGVGFEHRGANTSLVVNTQWATRDFSQVGEPLDPSYRIRRRSLLQGGVGLGMFGSLSAAWVRQTYQSAPTQQTVSLTHTVSFGRLGTLNFTLSRTRIGAQMPDPFFQAGSLPPLALMSAQNSTSAYLIYVLPIDGRRAVSATATGGSGFGAPRNELLGSITDTPPVGPGYGYRLTAGTAGDYDADWQQQGTGEQIEVEAARNLGIEGRSATVSGALTWLDGRVDTLRSVNGSFAMVDLGGLPDVPVYVENQLTARTDESGKALLFNLRPYEANHISIDPQDLPLDTTIGASSTLVAPPYRSGVVARFPVQKTRGGTFRLVMDDGQAVPVGAQVTFNGGQFPVVFDGKVYVTGYDHGTAGHAAWPGGQCEFRLEPPPADDPLPDLGVVRCRAAAAHSGTGR